MELLFKGLSHPDVIRYYGIWFDTPEATKAQLAWYDKIYADGTGIWWAITSKDGAFIDAIGFNNLVRELKCAEIGFWLLPESWRRGVLAEILPTVCGFAFEKLNLHRIHAEVETENVACKNTLSKAGFICEGTMRDCEFKDGKAISLEIYSKLHTDKRIGVE